MDGRGRAGGGGEGGRRGHQPPSLREASPSHPLSFPPIHPNTGYSPPLPTGGKGLPVPAVVQRRDHPHQVGRRRWAVRVGHQHLQASHRGMGGSAGWWLVGGRSEGWWWCAGAGPASHLPSAQKTQEPRPTSPAPAPTCTSPLGTFASTRLSPPSGPPWPTPTPAWTVPTTNWPASAQTSRASAAASPTWRPACCGRHRTRTRPRPRRPRRRPRPPWPCA